MKDKIIDSLKKVTGEVKIELEFPEQAEFGDYSTNIALILAKKKERNPKEVASEIVEKLKVDKELTKLASKIEVAGPGFINFFISSEALVDELKKINESYGASYEGKGKTVVIDYSSPNIAKRFGIGHLRSTVIGQAIYNLYKSLGYKVIGDNHLGDWGTQFGTLLYQVTSKKLDVKKLDIDKLEELYVLFHKKVEEDPKLWDEARAWFKKLEEGDKEARRLWKEMFDISMAEFERVYKLLGVTIDYAYGESFYEDKMPDVIAELKTKKLLVKSQGAEIVELANLPPAMVVKSDGGTTYFTRDLATIAFRLREWNPDVLIYEVGADQTLYFRQLFETVKLLGWAEDKVFVHIAHGLIRFLHGKMSTRGGQTIKLEEVLDEAIKKAKQIIDKSETGRGLSKEEKGKVGNAVGIGAVKYFDLMHHPTSDIIFDWEKIFVMEGNSGPYLQYTVARTNSVLSKAREVKEEKNLSSKLNKEEEMVLRTLVRFPEIIETAAKNYSPNLLANYLFELAQKYNNFYNRHRIIGGENRDFRLALTKGTGQVLKNGLSILGIERPERM